MTRHYRQIPFRSKFNSKRTLYNGRSYDSAAEANYAQELDWRKQHGEVKEWEAQKRYSLDVNGQHITNHFVDFRVVLGGGSIQLVEIKGMETDTWRLKRNLLLALLDELEPDGAEYLVVKAYGRQGHAKWTKTK